MFSMTSKFYQFCVIVYRLICLNALFLVFCLPIVTIGASFSALIHTLTTTDDVNIWGPFLRAFKRKFRRSLPLMAFNIASFLFVSSLQVTNIGGSSFLHMVKLVFISFIISYNINTYIVDNLFMKQNVMEVFRLTFIFTLGTFFKTCFFPLLVMVLAYFSLSVAGYGTLFLVISLPMMLYLRFIKKDRVSIEKNEELAKHQLGPSEEVTY